MTDWFHHVIKAPDRDFAAAAAQRQLQLTKPPGALGMLEKIAIQMSAMQARIDPAADDVEIAIFAGDHGIVAEGVSAFPQAVTAEMVKNFVAGGAAINVLARQMGAGLTVVNAGTVSRSGFGDAVMDLPVDYGTANFALGAAMTDSQCQAALNLGKQVVDQYAVDKYAVDQSGKRVQLLIGGEMGIGNTTAASAVAAAFNIASPAALSGAGSGLSEKGVAHKVAVIERALKKAGKLQSPQQILAQFAGFEMVALCGFYIAAAQKGLPILVDGFIACVCAYAACALNSGARDWMLFAHTSAEPGHKLVTAAMQVEPLLDLGMRLGEGSGAGVAVSIVRSACLLQNEMATFEQAGVSDGR